MPPTFGSKKIGSATQECPNRPGIICVVATRADTAAPLDGVSVVMRGPTPGSSSTDAMGIRQFDGRVPGTYSCEITFPEPRFKDWILLPHTKEISVSGGSVSILEVQGCPTGTLMVEIREEGGALIEGTAEVRASGPTVVDERVDGGARSFARVACGTYDVSARVSAKYQSQMLPAVKVTVPEGGSSLAKLVVPSVTWIEVRLITADGAPVANEEYAITAADGRQIRGKTDANGLARAEGIVPGKCNVTFPNLDKDAWKPA